MWQPKTKRRNVRDQQEHNDHWNVEDDNTFRDGLHRHFSDRAADDHRRANWRRPYRRESRRRTPRRPCFRLKLLAWREDILKEAKETLQHLKEENQNHPDIADRASSETDRAIELRARDRQRKLIAKIDEALTRIDDGTYGFCEETGEPISLRRPGSTSDRHSVC